MTIEHTTTIKAVTDLVEGDVVLETGLLEWYVNEFIVAQAIQDPTTKDVWVDYVGTNVAALDEDGGAEYDAYHPGTLCRVLV